jgi:hypothetical protein
MLTRICLDYELGLDPPNAADPGHGDVPLQVRAADPRSLPRWTGGQWCGDQQRQQQPCGSTGEYLLFGLPLSGVQGSALQSSIGALTLGMGQ